MTKPHEEEWVHVGRHVDERVGHTARAACVNDDDVPRFISAAPEMARALLAHVKACGCCNGTGLTSVRTPDGRADMPCSTCEDARAVLAKAGVLR